MKKRGVVLQSGTIKWILLILVAVVLLIATGIVLYNVLVVGPKACHYSIVFRSTFSSGILNFIKNFIPINCKEKKVCFSIGGDCSMFGDPKKVKKISVDGKDDSEIKKNIYKELADLHYEAHWAVGEGKIDFLPSNIEGPDVAGAVAGFFRGDEKNLFPSVYYCIIYGVFDFDDKLKEKENFKLNWVDFYRFMQDNPAPGKEESGLHYLYGINNIASVVDIMTGKDSTNPAVKKDPVKEFEWDISGIDVNGKKEKVQFAILVKGVKGNVLKDFLSKPETYGAAGAFLLSFAKFKGIGIPGASLIRKGALLYGGLQFIKSMDKIDMEYTPPAIIVNKAEYFEKSMCKEFPFSP